MAVLQDILYKVNILAVSGDMRVNVSSLCIDSRQVKEGALFFAIKGVQVDGHQFIENAINQGAVAVVCSTLPLILKDGVTYVQVADSAEAAGLVAHQFFGNVTEKIKLVGVTGTNGKTTVATLLYQLFTDLGYQCGLVSTVRNIIGQKEISATHTTPDPVSLNALLKQMADEGCSHVFMECSSHAIHQHRIAGLNFTGALFTNITHDHLDYHKSFDEYLKVKKSFFDNLPSSAFAISNLDDKRGAIMLQNTKARKLFYSLKTMADFKGLIMDNDLAGLMMQINGQEVHFRLIGEFNAYNLLAVFGAATELGVNKDEALAHLSTLRGAEGRFDYIVSPVDKIIGIVDYAHTPDALINVLKTLGELRKKGEQIITVAGCGGDRDRTKRPLMAKAACDLSDRVILTSDNPRSEDPEAILKEMEAGLNTAGKRKSISIVDRKEAIKAAITIAGKGDIILVAGKGHEKYQEIKGVKHDFDDKQVLKAMFELLGK
ncbi:MAG TPA: UDP-N-acetylmuramoyl-L-alanyl-D-glutamate--2,6-diaminopimelate ligase [Parasegetibacter sp.]|jgi:UDP-N-acetylmuramoyl-L-alanyl-D-glutamate--2,6-diaminopimelate ligase